MLRLPDRDLETERLVLEPLRARHAALLLPVLGDEAIYRFVPEDAPVSARAMELRYELLETRLSPDEKEAWLNWAVKRREDGAYLGTVQSTVYPDETAEVAYLFSPRFWRHGYGREAVARLVEHLFHDYGVAVVRAVMDTRNVASFKLAESLGFVRVGKTVEADFFKGGPSDEYRYELRAPGARRTT